MQVWRRIRWGGWVKAEIWIFEQEATKETEETKETEGEALVEGLICRFIEALSANPSRNTGCLMVYGYATALGCGLLGGISLIRLGYFGGLLRGRAGVMWDLRIRVQEKMN